LWGVTPCRMKQGSALGGGKNKEVRDSTVLWNILLFLPDYSCYMPKGSGLHTNGIVNALFTFCAPVCILENIM
jgi:hypothetical protein